MRVVSGQYRGRKLDAPQGMGTRPTTDRVKESMFSALTSAVGDLEGICAIDAFAGTGGLGIECLSRGASFVWFCDSDRKAQAVIEKNLRTVGAPKEAWRLLRSDVVKRPPNASAHPADVVLLDPPYAYDPETVVKLLQTLNDSRSLAPDAVAVYEHDRSLNFNDLMAENGREAYILSSKTFGDTAFDIFTIASVL